MNSQISTFNTNGIWTLSPNADGKVDAADARFGWLRVWRDLKSGVGQG